MIRLADFPARGNARVKLHWNVECRMSIDELWIRFAQSIYSGQNTLNPKSAFQNPKFAFGSFLSDQTGCPFSRGPCSYETFNISLAKAQSSQRKALKILIILAPLRLGEKIISFFCDQTGCPLAGGRRSCETSGND